MKRAINIFAAFVLIIMLILGSQVTSAFAASPHKFTLNEFYPMNFDANLSAFTVSYTNDNAKDVAVEVLGIRHCETEERSKIATIPAHTNNLPVYYTCANSGTLMFFNHTCMSESRNKSCDLPLDVTVE